MRLGVFEVIDIIGFLRLQARGNECCIYRFHIRGFLYLTARDLQRGVGKSEVESVFADKGVNEGDRDQRDQERSVIEFLQDDEAQHGDLID